MHIGNSQTQTYEYNTTQRAKYDNAYSSFVVDTKSVKENATLLTKNLIKFIDKSGGFSSLSKEDEELFRAILEDDEISTSEAKNLSYEQMAKLNQLFKNLDSGTFFIKGFDIFHKANISNDENFNKSLFETLKNIENESDRTLFSLNLKSDLGYNKVRLPFEKPIVIAPLRFSLFVSEPPIIPNLRFVIEKELIPSFFASTDCAVSENNFNGPAGGAKDVLLFSSGGSNP